MMVMNVVVCVRSVRPVADGDRCNSAEQSCKCSSGFRPGRTGCGDPLTQPGCKLRFRQDATSQANDDLDRIRLFKTQLESVVEQKKSCGNPGGSLVAVAESVIADDPTSVSCRKCRCIRWRLPVGQLLLRTRQRRLHQIDVLDAVDPAMLCQLHIVDGE